MSRWLMMLLYLVLLLLIVVGVVKVQEYLDGGNVVSQYREQAPHRQK